MANQTTKQDKDKTNSLCNFFTFIYETASVGLILQTTSYQLFNILLAFSSLAQLYIFANRPQGATLTSSQSVRNDPKHAIFSPCALLLEKKERDRTIYKFSLFFAQTLLQPKKVFGNRINVIALGTKIKPIGIYKLLTNKTFVNNVLMCPTVCVLVPFRCSRCTF